MSKITELTKENEELKKQVKLLGEKLFIESPSIIKPLSEIISERDYYKEMAHILEEDLIKIASKQYQFSMPRIEINIPEGSEFISNLDEIKALKLKLAVAERALKILGEYKPISLRDTDCPFTNDICMNIPDNTSCNECLVTQAMIDAQVEIKGDGILQKEKHGESEVPNEQ